MHSIHTFIGLLFFFAAGPVSYGLSSDTCSYLIKVPRGGFGINPIFPIINPEQLELYCMNLNPYRSCVNERYTDMKKFFTDHFILIEFLTHICSEYRNTYLNSSQCIGSYKKSAQVKRCVKEIEREKIVSGHYDVCSAMNERIECIGKTLAKCGSDAVRMSKHLINIIVKTAWDIQGISCSTFLLGTTHPRSDKSQPSTQNPNGSSKISSSALSVLPCILLFWFGIH